jgi:hypothetical protein
MESCQPIKRLKEKKKKMMKQEKEMEKKKKGQIFFRNIHM